MVNLDQGEGEEIGHARGRKPNGKDQKRKAEINVTDEGELQKTFVPSTLYHAHYTFKSLQCNL